MAVIQVSIWKLGPRDKTMKATQLTVLSKVVFVAIVTTF